MAQEIPNNNEFYINEAYDDVEDERSWSSEKRERVRQQRDEMFKNNCGNLSADTRTSRTSFIGNNRKVRFLVLGLGLQASGKTSGFSQARRYCQLLNSEAARKPWATVSVSHDHQIVNNKNYKIAIRTIFRSESENIWTKEKWDTSSAKKRIDFVKKMADAYFKIRIGTAITNQDKVREKYSNTKEAEEVRRILIREHNLGLEIPGRLRKQKKLDLQNDFTSFTKKNPIDNASLNKALNQPKYSNLKFSKKQETKIKNIKDSGGVAATYRNIRQAIIEGQNIEYEALGSSFITINKIFDVIVQSTKNCKEYTYIVISVLNLISIKDSYERQLCRFFNQSRTFVDAMNYGQSWGWNRAPLINPRANVWQIREIQETPAPQMLGLVSKNKNENLYNLMRKLITICNQEILSSNSYEGGCSGFGIDILLVSHSKPNLSDNIIATLPLSLRSQRLVKSSQPTHIGLRNKKFTHDLVIYILEQLTTGTYNRNPLLNDKINCTVVKNKTTDDIDDIINAFLKLNEGKEIAQNVLTKRREQGSLKMWKNTLSQGGKRRKKTRKRRKTRRKRKRRKTRRKRR